MNFVIIGSPRTGSSLLTNLLNGHDDILCHGEIFLVRERSEKIPVRWGKEGKDDYVMSELWDLRERDPEAFLQRIFAQNYGRGSVGFKIFSGQNDAILDSLIPDESVKKIVLFRRNVLAVHSSALIARRTRGTEGRSRSRRPETKVVVEFKPEGFRRFCLEYMEFYRRIFGQLNAARQAFHLINYEQINDPWHFASLVTFIGGNPTEVRQETKLVKQNSPYILSRYSNPEDVSAFLERYGLKGWEYEMETSLDPLREPNAE